MNRQGQKTFGVLLILTAYICLSLILPFTAWAATEETPDSVDEQMGRLDMGEIQSFVDQMDRDLLSTLPEINFKELVAGIAMGEISMEPMEIFNQSLAYIFRELVANAALLGKLIVLAVICAVLQNISGAFEKASTAQLTHMVAYLVLVTIAIGSFGMAIQLGREVVDNLVAFMQALLPLLLTLLVAVGGIASAAIFHPIIFITITVFGTVIKNIILPLIFFSAVLEIVNGLSKEFQVSKLGGLFKTAAAGLMGLMSTIFLGVLSLQGVAGAVADSVTFRTAKFAAHTFVPVVGGVFSDALEAVIRSSLLIKNAVGIAGVLIIIMLLVIPLVKILAIAFIYKLAGAVIQPVGEEKISDCLNSLGGSLITVFGAVAIVGLLFFFALAILVGLGNFTVMLH